MSRAREDEPGAGAPGQALQRLRVAVRRRRVGPEDRGARPLRSAGVPRSRRSRDKAGQHLSRQVAGEVSLPKGPARLHAAACRAWLRPCRAAANRDVWFRCAYSAAMCCLTFASAVLARELAGAGRDGSSSLSKFQELLHATGAATSPEVVAAVGSTEAAEEALLDDRRRKQILLTIAKSIADRIDSLHAAPLAAPISSWGPGNTKLHVEIQLAVATFSRVWGVKG